MRRTGLFAPVLAAGFVGITVSVAAAQTASQPASGPIRTSATEIASTTEPGSHGGEVEKGRSPLPWLEPHPTGGPQVQGFHYYQEYMSVVTPPAFRRAALFSGSQVAGDPGKGLGRLRSAWRERQERKAREQVERELDQITQPR